MSVIYIDLGCSDGKTVSAFLDRRTLLPELANQCDAVYAFDPIRYSNWEQVENSYHNVNFYECAVGIAQGHAWLSMNENPEARTIVQANKNYEEAPLKQRVKVIDFCAWFDGHVHFEDTVIVKMDIEGAEYVILDKLIETKLISRINHLFVEFHSSGIIDEKKEAYIQAEQKIRAECPIEIHPLKA